MKGVYMAGELTNSISFGDPTVYARNVRAIEAVSGCKVDLASVINNYGSTTASTVCDNGTS